MGNNLIEFFRDKQLIYQPEINFDFFLNPIGK